MFFFKLFFTCFGKETKTENECLYLELWFIQGTWAFYVPTIDRDGIQGTGLLPLQRQEGQMNGRGRGVSPDGALSASGRMPALVPITSPSTATGGCSFFSFFAADAHVLRLWSLPELKTHVSHRPLVPQKHFFSKGPLLRILSANECDAQRFQVSSPWSVKV